MMTVQTLQQEIRVVVRALVQRSLENPGECKCRRQEQLRRDERGKIYLRSWRGVCTGRRGGIFRHSIAQHRCISANICFCKELNMIYEYVFLSGTKSMLPTVCVCLYVCLAVSFDVFSFRTHSVILPDIPGFAQIQGGSTSESGEYSSTGSASVVPQRKSTRLRGMWTAGAVFTGQAGWGRRFKKPVRSAQKWPWVRRFGVSGMAHNTRWKIEPTGEGDRRHAMPCHACIISPYLR